MMLFISIPVLSVYHLPLAHLLQTHVFLWQYPAKHEDTHAARAAVAGKLESQVSPSDGEAIQSSMLTIKHTMNVQREMCLILLTG
jgi:hypothetical protein